MSLNEMQQIIWNFWQLIESCFDCGNSFKLQLDMCLYFTSSHSNVTNISYLNFLIKISWSFIFGAYCRIVNVTVNSPTSLPLCDYFTAATQYTRYTQKIKMIPACLRDSKGPVMLQTQEQSFSRTESQLHIHQGRSKAAGRLHIYIGTWVMLWEPGSWAGGGHWQEGEWGGSVSIGGGCFYFCLDFFLWFLCVIWRAAKERRSSNPSYP